MNNGRQVDLACLRLFCDEDVIRTPSQQSSCGLVSGISGEEGRGCGPFNFPAALITEHQFEEYTQVSIGVLELLNDFGVLVEPSLQPSLATKMQPGPLLVPLQKGTQIVASPESGTV